MRGFARVDLQVLNPRHSVTTKSLNISEAIIKSLYGLQQTSIGINMQEHTPIDTSKHMRGISNLHLPSNISSCSALTESHMLFRVCFTS